MVERYSDKLVRRPRGPGESGELSTESTRGSRLELVFCQIGRPILSSLVTMGVPDARRGARRAVLSSIVVLALTAISGSVRSEVGTQIQIAGA